MNETQIIPREEWFTFANDFSAQHAGENATLEMVGPDVGDQYAAQNMPFVGINLDIKGSDTGSLIVMLGTEGEKNMERFIAGPQSLEVHVTPEGETVLQIKAADEPDMLLHLTPLAALPAPKLCSQALTISRRGGYYLFRAKEGRIERPNTRPACRRQNLSRDRCRGWLR